MQILTFSPVSVRLDEIHGFKWVIGCFSLVFAARSIVRSTSLGGGLKLVWGFFVV